MAEITLTRTIGATGRDYSTPQLWEDDCLTDLVTLTNATAWASSTSYAIGDFVKNDTGPVKLYICTTAGTSAGSGGPTGTGSGIADNDVVWDYVADTSADTLIWKGEFHNDAEFTQAGTMLTISGQTTSAAGYLHLTVAAGDSFADDDTNALEYDAANGAGWRNTGGYASGIISSVQYTIIERLQIKCTGNGSIPLNVTVTSGGDNQTFRNFITESGNASAFQCQEICDVVNAVIISRATGSFRDFVVLNASGSRMVGVTICNPSNLSQTQIGIDVNYGRPIITGTAIFGATTAIRTQGGAGHNASTDYNATDLTETLPGSNNLESETYSATVPFQDSDDSTANTLDLRLSAGSNLEGAAAQHALTNDLDIFGNARDVSTPDIGAFEVQAAGGGPVIPVFINSYRQRQGMMQ